MTHIWQAAIRGYCPVKNAGNGQLFGSTVTGAIVRSLMWSTTTRRVIRLKLLFIYCALLKFTDDILKLFDQKKVAIATFMDLSKTFDCVDHNSLLSKLKLYGIHETTLQWINSYLSDRTHFVSWNLTHSPVLNLKIFVPQGSFFGPYCFCSTLTILLIPVISCRSFSLLMTPQHMFNMIQLMAQFKSLTRN